MTKHLRFALKIRHLFGKKIPQIQGSLLPTGQTADLIERETLEFLGQDVRVNRKPRRKSISIAVKPSGQITVGAWKSASEKEILKSLKEHEKWIQANLDEFKEVRKKYPAKKYMNGEKFLFLGEEITLLIKKASPSVKRSSVLTYLDGKNLICEIPAKHWKDSYLSKPLPFLKKSIHSFYKTCSEVVLTQRLEKWAKLTSLHPTSFGFRAQKTLWGSCSSTGDISLNWKLLIAPLAIIDYVIIHELCHIKHMDHSKKFWDLVNDHCAQYKIHRKWLRQNQYEFDWLSRKSELYP